MWKEHEIILLPTDTEAAIWLRPDSNLSLSIKGQPPLYGKNKLDWKGQALYILSDEEIQIGDYYVEHTQIKPDRYEIYQRTIDDVTIENSKKIIATTDTSLFIQTGGFNGFTKYQEKDFPKISQSFIELFVSEYNKGNKLTKVFIEYKSKYKKECDCFKVDITDGCNVKEHCEIIENLKIDSFNTVNIRPIKDSFTRGEVEKQIDNLLDIVGNRLTTCFRERNSSNKIWFEHSRESIKKEWIKTNL